MRRSAQRDRDRPARRGRRQHDLRAPQVGLLRKASVTARRMRELLTVHVYAYTIRPMKLMSLPCYCATLRQAARAVTVLYEDMLAGSGLHATQFTALQLLSRARSLTTPELAEAPGVPRP